jgi:hypothetical protein
MSNAGVSSGQFFEKKPKYAVETTAFLRTTLQNHD